MEKNKVDVETMKFGQCEKSIFIFIIGLFIFALLVVINSVVRFQQGEGIPFWYSLLIIMGCFIQFMSMLWLIFKVRGSRVLPQIDETLPEEAANFRVTSDGIIFSDFVNKGIYGKAETVNYGKNADYMDDGLFPMRTLNGNPAMITYDLVNTSLDLRRSIARKYMKRYVKDGPDAYKIWKQKKTEGKVWKIKK